MRNVAFETGVQNRLHDARVMQFLGFINFIPASTPPVW
jgi:hypothetical protein